MGYERHGQWPHGSQSYIHATRVIHVWRPCIRTPCLLFENPSGCSEGVQRQKLQLPSLNTGTGICGSGYLGCIHSNSRFTEGVYPNSAEHR